MSDVTRTIVSAPGIAEDEVLCSGYFACDTRAVDDAESRVLKFIGSTAIRDRMGDEIDVAGWDVANYTKNPVFLWAHDYSKPPIGHAVNVEKTDKALKFDIEFVSGAVDPFAEHIFQLYKQGFMKAVSVGFTSKKSDWIDRNDEDEARKSKKEPDAPVGRRFAKVELLELSAVPVPANPQALIDARRKGLVVPWLEDAAAAPSVVETKNVTPEAATQKQVTQPEAALAGTPREHPVIAVEPVEAKSADGDAIRVVTTTITNPQENKTMADNANPTTPTQPAPSVNFEELINKAVEKALFEARRTEPSKVAVTDTVQHTPEERAYEDKVRKAVESNPRNLPPANEFSFVRFLMAQIDRDWDAAKYERYALDASRRRLNSLQKTAIGWASGSAGGYWVDSELLPQQFVEYYYANLVAKQAGITILPCSGAPVNIPKITSGTTTYWMGQNHAIDEASPTPGTLSLTPHFCGCRVQLSKFMVTASPGAAESIIRQDMGSSLAAAVDHAILEGVHATATVNEEPTGFANIASINTVSIGTHAGAITMAYLDDMILALDTDNVPQDTRAFIMHPRTWHVVGSLMGATSAGNYLFSPLGMASTPLDKRIRGIPVFTTTNLSSNITVHVCGLNCAHVFLVRMRDAILAEWGGIELAATDVGGNAWAQNAIEVRGTYACDVGVRNPNSICQMYTTS